MHRRETGGVPRGSGSRTPLRGYRDALARGVVQGPTRIALVLTLVLALAAVACTSPPSDGSDGESPGSDALSPYEGGALVVGRVVDNVTACEVDATCSLRIAFADTTVTGVYGTGERPAPPCEIARGVSDLAFTLRPGDRVRVDLRPCGDEGWLYVATLGE